ncbi:MAG: type II toxin-antitoxin system RelE/ParE family toxin [Nitrospirae bacterium]|nr:type II toxin-antitoxin system RelE/ParE family toxin [Nitrospirota bacterium]
MKKFHVRISSSAGDVIKKLHPEIKKLIREAIESLRTAPLSGDELQGELGGYRALKPKRYRIIYKADMEKFLIEIYFLRPRRDVYENFRKLLEQIRRG